MPAPATALADAYVTLLNAAALSVPLAAVRDYLPLYDLKDLATLHTTVIPRQDDSVERFNRAAWRHEVIIDISLQKKWATLVQADMDALVALADEVCEFCKGNLPAGRPEKLERATVQALWEPDLLRERKIFTSVVSLTLLEAR